MDLVSVNILCRNGEYSLKDYLECIYAQTYPKDRILLYIRTNDNTDSTKEILSSFVRDHSNEYYSIYYSDTDLGLPESKNHEWNIPRFKVMARIRQESIEYSIKNKCHYFVCDCDNFITSNTIEELVKLKSLGVVAPMLKTTPGMGNEYYSNFHYSTDSNGYYLRNDYYYSILDKTHTGVFKVDVVHCTYFINNSLLNQIEYSDSTNRHEYVIFSDSLRKKGINQYINNIHHFGFLSLNDSKDSISKERKYWRNAKKGYKAFNTEYGMLILYRNDKFITSSFNKGEYWDIETLLKVKEFIDPAKQIIEVGAHCGTSTLFYSKYSNNLIHAFEPQKNMYELLLLNMENNGLLDQVKTYNAACFNTPGKGRMHSIDLDGGGGVVKDRYNDSKECNFGGVCLGEGGEEVDFVTIDSFKFDNIGFMHVDAQGAESAIFEGAIETINKNKPNILFEDNNNNYLAQNVGKYYSSPKFNIIEYCLNVLGYSNIIHVSGIDYLLIYRE
jgi:FkbM family methyltransferase